MSTLNYLKSHQTSIMLGAGVAGLILNSICWFNAGLKCYPIIDEVNRDPTLDDKAKTKLKCKRCLPYVAGPALITVGEGALMVKHHMDMGQQLALATALASSRAAAEADLRRQIHKELGETAATRIENHTLEEEIKRAGPPQNVQQTGHGDTLVRNMIGGSDFFACYAHLEKSINLASEICRNDGMVTVNTFYNIIGIDSVDMGDLVVFFEEDMVDGKIPVKITSIVDEKYDAILAISTDSLHGLQY